MTVSFGGYSIVLTGEIATMSDTHGSSVVGFASAIPENYFRDWVARKFFRVRSNREGRVFRAPYGLSKVEAALLAHGYTKNDVIIADPYKLDRVIGPNTRIVGIYVMDPLGLSYGSGIVYWILKLADLPYRGLPYIAKSFLQVISHPAIKRHRDHLKIVVGGPAGWQIVDTGRQSEFSIDVVYEGEFEEDGPQLFDKLMKGEPVPNRVAAHRPVPVEFVPTIVTPSIGGMVEVTRGCGRGCQFCTPTLSGMIRSFPFEGHIDREIKLNIEVGGFREITLHSEEFFRYGAKGIEPNPGKVLDLTEKAYKLVKSYGDDYELTTDFTTAAVVKYAPNMVKEVSEYMNEGGTWHFIEMGIETGSPRLLRVLMAGKALPYKPEQYPGVVEEAIGILNDNHWVVVGTMILNLPGETDDDVIRSLELLDRISKLRVLTFPLPFIPMGALRKRDFTILDRLLEDPLRREFILKAFIKSFEEAKAFSSLITRKVENFIVRRLIGYLAVSSFNLVLKRYKDKLGSLIEQYGEFRERIKEEVNRASVSIRLHDDFDGQ